MSEHEKNNLAEEADRLRDEVVRRMASTPPEVKKRRRHDEDADLTTDKAEKMSQTVLNKTDSK